MTIPHAMQTQTNGHYSNHFPIHNTKPNKRRLTERPKQREGRKHLRPPGFSTQMECTHCGHVVRTDIKYKAGAFAWLSAFGFLLFTVVGVCIPFCVDAFKDVIHVCPRCKGEIGRVYRV
ncbi:uncharacterized protein VTP21DRAFT_4091 [Calcarisporiella thermophila]|uniref:uncharacterized protein n=1 Tax=Calcarisporiella thermophila TaxID=911321 RepID=UPI0037424CF3